MKTTKNNYEIISRSSSYAVHFKEKDYMIVCEIGENGYYSFEIYDNNDKKIENEELKEWFLKTCNNKEEMK